MILIDSSAWIEFLRDTGSNACIQVNDSLDKPFAVADPIRMELLAGARSERQLHSLRGLLARGTTLQTLPLDFDEAARIYRQCRLNGDTVRKLIDCLIAGIAIRHDIPLLHQDADFDRLSRHTGLEIVGSL